MFRTSLSQLEGEQLSKTSSKPSLTVPHQVYTVREIIQRSQRGLPIASRPIEFESDTIEPDIDNPEDPFVDRFEAIETVREYYNRHRDRANYSESANPQGSKRSEAKAKSHEEEQKESSIEE